jgi:hypothetical protein
MLFFARREDMDKRQAGAGDKARGAKEQELLHEDPARLIERQAPPDPAVEASIEERRSGRLEQEFRLWWQGLSPEQVLELAERRDELLLLLNERFGYSRQEAELELQEALARLRDAGRT